MTRYADVKAPRGKYHIGVVVFLLACGLVLILFGHREPGENANPHPTAMPGSDGVPQVVLKPNQASQYVTSGLINGERVEFLVDTGSADVAMPYQVAQRLNLRLTSGGVNMTGNGSVQGWSAVLDAVDVGGLVARQVKATILPNMLGEQILLGMAYLKHIEMTLARGEMTLRPPVSR
jgi:aspartyl protease family protein